MISRTNHQVQYSKYFNTQREILISVNQLDQLYGYMNSTILITYNL